VRAHRGRQHDIPSILKVEADVQAQRRRPRSWG
jgi:hypothetical protein